MAARSFPPEWSFAIFAVSKTDMPRFAAAPSTALSPLRFASSNAPFPGLPLRSAEAFVLSQQSLVKRGA